MATTLQEKISLDFKQAMINKEVIKKNILSIIIGEIQKKSKRDYTGVVFEEEVLDIIKKTLKPINEVIEICDPDSEFYQTSIKEKEILEAYLPKMMNDDEIRYEIKIIDNGNLNLGSVMKHFSSLNADKSIVRTIFENEFK